MESKFGIRNYENIEKHVNEMSEEATQEVSAAINASARQSIRPYNSQATRFQINYYFR